MKFLVASVFLFVCVAGNAVSLKDAKVHAKVAVHVPKHGTKSVKVLEHHGESDKHFYNYYEHEKLPKNHVRPAPPPKKCRNCRVICNFCDCPHCEENLLPVHTVCKNYFPRPFGFMLTGMPDVFFGSYKKIVLCDDGSDDMYPDFKLLPFVQKPNHYCSIPALMADPILFQRFQHHETNFCLRTYV